MPPPDPELALAPTSTSPSILPYVGILERNKGAEEVLWGADDSKDSNAQGIDLESQHGCRASC